MSHSDNDISRFLPFFDISVSFDNLFERIASVDYGSVLSGLDEFFKKGYVFFPVFWNGKPDLFAAEYPSP